jgi:glutathione peroxidase
VKELFGSIAKWFNNGKSSGLKESIYDYTANTIDGREVHLSKYQGRPLMIVNTASNCAFTSQYAGLQELHKKYGDRITILGFPSNNFMWQEPGSNKTISSFCALNYGVTFQMFEKISVKGRDQHPLFYWLEVHAKHRPTWNFCKYLIDKKGNVVAFYPAKVDPLDPAVTGRILSLV